MIQIRWTWALVPLLVTLFAVQTCALVSKENQADALRMTVEAERMRADGLAVGQVATERQLRDAIADADSLRTMLAQAPRGSTPREVVKWKTRSVEIPSPSTPCDGSSPPSHEPGPVPLSPASAPFSVRLEGSEARMESRAGALFAVGSVDIVRTSPPPEERIATLPWEAAATEYIVAVQGPKRRAGWGLGPAVGLVDGEWVYGGAATGPALGGRVALQPAAWALAGDGHWTAAGSMLLTW